MEIGLWLLSFFLMAIETWGSVYFFDTFMERKRMERLERSRYIVYCFVFVYCDRIVPWRVP